MEVYVLKVTLKLFIKITFNLITFYGVIAMAVLNITTLLICFYRQMQCC